MTSCLARLGEPQSPAVTLPHISALILAGRLWQDAGAEPRASRGCCRPARSGHPPGWPSPSPTRRLRRCSPRLSALVPVNVRSMWIGTFHGLQSLFLRMHWREAGLPQTFTIMDTQDQVSLIKRILKAHNIDDEKLPPKQMAWFIGSAKEKGCGPTRSRPLTTTPANRWRFTSSNEATCQREGVVDFVEPARSHGGYWQPKALREHYNARFKHILVDEFRTPIRSNTSGCACSPARRQRCWQWGMTISRSTPSVAPRSPTCSGLSMISSGKNHQARTNYRSFGNILDVANALIRNNNGRLGAELVDQGHGEPIRVFQGYSDGEEAAFVIDSVKTAMNEGVLTDDRDPVIA